MNALSQSAQVPPCQHGGCGTMQRPLVPGAGEDASAPAHQALEELCRRYWYPVYAFIRRRGSSHHEAEDLSREFFAELLSSDTPARADPRRGRLRTFLFTSLSLFITDEWRCAHAARRDGGERLLPPATEDADERFAREPIDPGLTPCETFDHHWAMSTIERAIADLRTECVRARRGAPIDALGPFVWGGSIAPPQAEAAAALGMTEHAFTAAVHRLRHRLREHLRTLVAATVADPADVDSELRFLLAVVRRRPVAA